MILSFLLKGRDVSKRYLYVFYYISIIDLAIFKAILKLVKAEARVILILIRLLKLRNKKLKKILILSIFEYNINNLPSLGSLLNKSNDSSINDNNI